MINPESEEIISLAFAKGKVHDFQLFKNSKMHLKSVAQLTADSGYQGLRKLHANSVLPKKWECWLNNYLDRFIDMKGRVKEHRQINHFDGAGNTASFPSKSCKPVSLRKVVTFDQMCF